MKLTIQYILAIKILAFIPFFGNGQVVYQKIYDLGGWDKANNIQVLDGNRYLISGNSSGGTLHIIKINGWGDTLMTKTLDITSDKSKIIIGNDNNFFIAGHTADFGAGNSDVHLIRTDTNLNIQWVKSYGGG